ncbi:MAG: CRTAC1 family protein [Acidobacteriaceae bacterium]|nr:CRTAC1 family protein [Acidobacteriaceae bacterium]
MPTSTILRTGLLRDLFCGSVTGRQAVLSPRARSIVVISMAIGSVPRSYLFLAAALLAATPAFHANFTDLASVSGLTGSNVYGGLGTKAYILETTGNGVAIFDYDGDGKNDLFFANGTRLGAAGQESRPYLYHNEGDGHFKDVTAQAGFTQNGWSQGVCVGDFDNDGRPDLLVTAYGHNTLYRNLGNGRFEDVTAKAGLPTSGIRYGSGCSFVDYNRDGYLDIFVANYVDLNLEHTPHPGQGEFCTWKGIAVMCGPRGLPKAHNVLYRNNRDGTFTDVSETAGILKPGGRYALGVVAADFDNDGWPDIYVACDMTPSLLYHNRHDGTFEERGAEAGVAYNFDGALQAGMGVAVADYDGDGLLDIAKTNFSGDLPSLFHNDDGKFFTDVSREAGLATRQLLGWGVAFVDVDDDGWRDLIIANGHVYPEVEGKQLGDTYLQPTVLYRNLGIGKFNDVTDDSGPALRTSRPARGLAVGDLDGDGRPEIVLVNMNSTPSLLKNTGPHGHFFNLNLIGTKSNRSAIGAHAIITVGSRKMIDEIMSGGSYYSQNSFTLHFGLGQATQVDTIEVRWPSGIVQKLGPSSADRTLSVTER